MSDFIQGIQTAADAAQKEHDAKAAEKRTELINKYSPLYRFLWDMHTQADNVSKIMDHKNLREIKLLTWKSPTMEECSASWTSTGALELNVGHEHHFFDWQFLTQLAPKLNLDPGFIFNNQESQMTLYPSSGGPKLVPELDETGCPAFNQQALEAKVNKILGTQV